MIDKTSLAKCSPHCYLDVSLFLSPADQKSQENEFDISLLVIGSMTSMTALTDYAFTLEPQQMKYFVYDMGTSEQEGLLFSVESFQGHPVVFHKIIGDD